MTKFIILIVLLGISVFISIMIGPVRLTPDVFQLRLSRVILGIFAGGILAFCGGILQGLFGNPLVEPYTMGSASGAALGAAIGMLFFGAFRSIFAFGGALGVGLTVYMIARIEGGLLRDRLILAGVIMSFLCSSLVMIALIAGGRELYDVLYLLMGYLGIVINSANRILIIILIFTSLILIISLYRYHRELDIISGGTETAAGLGIDIQRFSMMVFITTSLLVGLVVSIVGAIGFVGLIIPHISRMMFGAKHRRNLPAMFLLGGSFLLLADCLARTLTVYELPVGVVTSILGVPFFIYLFRRRVHV
jgi:iron complex transport system permease protein